MPLYLYECPTHQAFELLLPLAEAEAEVKPCPRCGMPGERVPARVTMKPDDLWAGHDIEGYGHITSASKLARIRKEKSHITLHGRDDVEAMKKAAAEGRKAREAKLDRDIKEAFEGNFAGSGVVDSFGAPTPDAFKKLSDEPITSVNDLRIA